MTKTNDNVIDSLRCIGNISKLHSKLSIGIAKNHKIANKVVTKDYSVCNNCNIYKTFQEQKDNLNAVKAIESCQSNCSLILTEKKEVKYINEKNRLKLSDDSCNLTLPKIPLKLYLLFHFMPEIDSLGLIKSLSIISMANTIGCTTKSIRRALLELQEKGYIVFSEAGTVDRVNIVILSYKYNYLSKKDGGTGYIKIPNTVLLEILKADNINDIRLIMRLLFIESKNNPNRGNKDLSNKDKEIDSVSKRRSFVSYNEIKSYLPDYMNSEPAIIEKLNSLKNVFYIEYYDDKIIFETMETSDFVSVKSTAETDALLTFLSFDNYLSEEDSVQLTRLSLRHGLNKTKNALIEATKIYKDKFKEKVDNIAGLVTTIIKNNQILALI